MLAVLRPRAGTALPADAPTDAPTAGVPSDFDWHAAEQQVEHIVEPSFVEDSTPDPDLPSAFSVEPSEVRFGDVGGMEAVKQRLTVAFLAPLANPEAPSVVRQEPPWRSAVVRPSGVREDVHRPCRRRRGSAHAS